MHKSAYRRSFLAIAFYAFVSVFGSASAQEILQVLEPGIGFSRFKQWAIENKLVFENFTKDSLVVRDTGLSTWESIRIQARFCAEMIIAAKHRASSFSNYSSQKLTLWSLSAIT